MIQGEHDAADTDALNADHILEHRLGVPKDITSQRCIFGREEVSFAANVGSR